MIIDFTPASVNNTSSLSDADEPPLSVSAQTRAACFEIDLQAAQLVSELAVLGISPTDVPLNEPESSDTSEEAFPPEQMMWLGVTLPLPMELRPRDAAAGIVDGSPPISRHEFTQVIEVGLSAAGDPHEKLLADPQSLLIDPDPIDSPTLEAGPRFTPETISPAIIAPSSPMNAKGMSDSPLSDIPLPQSDQTSSPLTADDDTPAIDTPVLAAENTVTIHRSTGPVSAQLNEVHTNISSAAAPSKLYSSATSVELRTELSEVVRQVRTMITEQETRTTIQLEPAGLGRMTLELVDAPAGLRAHVSAEDPAVLRFLERNVQLLETEARLQRVGHMSFSVGANASGGPGRGDQRQSESEASFRKNNPWSTTPPAKPRSRRELDTNA